MKKIVAALASLSITIQLNAQLIIHCPINLPDISVSGSTTVYTKWGKGVSADLHNDISSVLRDSVTNWYSSTYTLAEVLGSATDTYNCHSYAWNMSDNGSVAVTCWINYPYVLGYMATNDYYGQVSGVANARKVHYYLDDHSAVTAGTDLYISKWGRGPLMRHAAQYCPYPNCSYRKYYSFTTRTGTLSTSGSYFAVGQTSNFSVPTDGPSCSGLSYSWSCEDSKGDNAVSNGKVTIILNGSTARIKFNRSGEYHVTCAVTKTSTGEIYAVYTLSDMAI